MSISKEEREEWRKRSMNQFCADDILRQAEARAQFAEEKLAAITAVCAGMEVERDVLAKRLDFHGHLPCSENGDCPHTDPEACTNGTNGDCWVSWSRQEAQRQERV